MPPHDAADAAFMRRAIELSAESVAMGGGPFGAVVVRDGRVIAEGMNRVTLAHDPTAHAEVVAIRRACEALETHSLARATIYSSCEPCPMCLAAIHWARIGRLVFAATRNDAEASGFDDSALYEQVALAPEARRVPGECMMREEALAAHEIWRGKVDRAHY